MSFPDEMYLPSDEELTVPELNVTSHVLKAGAVYIGESCLDQNNEYMLCRKELNDPRKCLEEGKAVTACAMKFFQQVKKSCYGEFMQYVNCLDKSSYDGRFEPCRQTQGVYDKCMHDNLGMERPPYDKFARVQVHHAKRPKPEIEPRPVYEPIPKLPEDAEKPRAKYGSRYMFLW